jgi:hypothetical protein
MPGESREPIPPRRRSRVFAVACDNYYYPGLRALLPSIAAYHGLEIPVFLYHRDLSKAQLQELGRLGVELCPFGLTGLPFPAPGMWEAKQQIFAHCIGRARCVYLLDADLVLVSALDRGCTLRIRRRHKDGRLTVWNSTERTRQRLVHSSGPKWWTAEGAAHLRQFGDKLHCFEHFLILKPPPKARLHLPCRAVAQSRKRDVRP